MTIFVAIPIRQSDAHLTEPLLDWIRELNGGNATETHVLLAYAKNVHGEQRAKIRIAAELAFQSVDELATGADSASEVELCNKLFKEMAQAVGERYRWPWLCLSPACVPLKKDWLAELDAAYVSQPKRYLGPHLKTTLAGRENLVLGRTSIYPSSAFNEIREYCDGLIGYEFTSSIRIVPRSTGTKLVQFGKWPATLREDTAVFDGDASGLLVRERLEASQLYPPCQILEERTGSYVSAFEEPKPEPEVVNGNGNGHAEPSVDTLLIEVRKKTGRVSDLATRLGIDEVTIRELMAQSGGRITVGRGAWLKVKDA